MKLRFILVLTLALGTLFLTGCGLFDTPPPVSPAKSESGAVQAKPFVVPVNSQGHTTEQQNIYDRQRVTTDPTKVLWIHLIALDGKIIRRMPVRCKATSSNKRLEPKHLVAVGWGQGGDSWNLPTEENGFHTDEKIGPDGTYGDSDNYIFWFDPMHRYHQYGTAGGIGYLLTDYPIDLANPMDEVTGMYNMQKAAWEWQQRQEEKLRAEEAQTKK
jgi:hypothetical protein